MESLVLNLFNKQKVFCRLFTDASNISDINNLLMVVNATFAVNFLHRGYFAGYCHICDGNRHFHCISVRMMFAYFDFLSQYYCCRR